MDFGEHDSPSSDDGRETLTGGARRQVPRWVVVVGVLVAAVAATVVLVQGRHPQAPPSANPAATPPPPTMPAGDAVGGFGGARGAGSDDVVVREVGHPVLGVAADWEVFAYTRHRGALVRIELAEGRITRTAVPPLQSGGPVSLLVGPLGALVHPIDYVPGYLVLDGHCARPQPVDDGGLVLPGPRAGQIWVQSGDGRPLTMRLTAMDGHATDRTLTVPFDDAWPVTADGRGHVLAAGAGGTYRVRADGRERVTTGSVLAVGPTAWLVVECDEAGGCRELVIDSDTGTRHRLGRAHGSSAITAGVVAPDGGAAAVLKLSGSQGSTLHLVDLTTGADRLVDVPAGRLEPGPALAWSPDSRWLFVAADGLRAVDTQRHRVVDLGRRLGLGGVTQVAVRRR